MNAFAWTTVSTIGLFVLSAILGVIQLLLERRSPATTIALRAFLEGAVQTLVCCAVGALWGVLFYLTFAWKGWHQEPAPRVEISTR